ncbi:MAG: tetratricopeptide repeat protein, partial [Bacteroidota bacterium]
MDSELSVAILPLTNLSGAEELTYFGDGLAEEIINALTRVSGLRVTARTSSFAYRDREVDVRAIGRELGVISVLEGSVRGGPNRVRITLQLIAASDGFHYWSDTFERSLEDVFAVEDEISRLVADKLREHVRHFEFADQLLPRSEVTAAAHREFIRARYLVNRYNKPDVERGIAALTELTQRYPHYDRPWLTLNRAYLYLGAIGALSAAESFPRARAALNQARAINPNSAEVQMRLGGVAFWEEWDLLATHRHLRRALERQPGNAEAVLWLGVVYAAEANFSTALHYVHEARALDPHSVLVYDFLGSVHYFRGDFSAAEQALRHALTLDPNYLMSHVQLGAVQLQSGRLEEGLKTFGELPATGDHDLSRLGGVALAEALRGRVAVAREGLQQLERATNNHAAADRALFFRLMIH